MPLKDAKCAMSKCVVCAFVWNYLAAGIVCVGAYCPYLLRCVCVSVHNCCMPMSNRSIVPAPAAPTAPTAPAAPATGMWHIFDMFC